ncbi:cytochrome P450 oxidoreductase [Leptodontidium sp. MPI-SDFR-AT-0119]|nr:cytochrome P450 oxidoreductase [Leptodontidium sp. MPI-SDFR-AT-0119]
MSALLLHTLNRLSVQILLSKYIPALVLAITTIYFLRIRYATPLRKVPGPFLLSCSKLPLFVALWKGKVPEWDLAMHKRYGPVVRVGPQTVAVSNPEDINNIYGTKSNFCKSRFFETFSTNDEEGLVPDAFVIREKDYHSRLRRSAANAYAASAVPGYEKNVDKVIDRCVAFVKEKKLNKAFDFGFLLRNTVTDGIYSINFGDDLKLIENEDNGEILERLELYMHTASVTGVLPWLHKYVLANPWFFNKLMGKDNPFMPGFIFTMTKMEEMKKNFDAKSPDTNTTFLDKIYQNQLARPESLTDREMMTHAFGNTTAGSDTTSTAVRSVFYFTLKNPHVYEKLCAEVRNAGLERPVSAQATARLPYLVAVIREAIRIHPPVGMILPRVVPDGGATIGGYYLPEGVEVGISPWVIHHDSEVFPNPGKFDPERWLTKDEGLLLKMNRSFFAFGAGPRTCSGRYISAMQTQKLVATMFLEFDMRLENPDKDWEVSARWFTPQKGLDVIIETRK